MALTQFNDIGSRAVGGTTLAPQTLAAAVTTNPALSVDMKDSDGLCSLIATFGTVAATGGQIQAVESDTGLAGSWTAITNPSVVAPYGVINIGTANSNGIAAISFNRTKRYVGALVPTLTGGNAVVGIAVIGQTKYTPS